MRSATEEAVTDVWEKAVDVQMHFNAMMAQTRRITAFIVLGLFIAATSNSFDDIVYFTYCCHEFSLSMLASAGTLFATFALVSDRLYYHRLLMEAVHFAERLELTFPEELALSSSLSRAVSPARAHLLAYAFYGGLICIGLVLMFMKPPA